MIHLDNRCFNVIGCLFTLKFSEEFFKSQTLGPVRICQKTAEKGYVISISHTFFSVLILLKFCHMTFKTLVLTLTLISTIQLLQVAEAAIRRAETSLREADSYISQEGRQALAEALRALQQFGKQSQQMTEIAQRAKDESIK